MRIAPAALLVLIAVFPMSACGVSDPLQMKYFQTYSQRKYDGVVSQNADFSCGAASLATLSTYYWGRNVSEVYVLKILEARYPDKKAWAMKLKTGFSLDDLEFAAAALGFNAQSVEISVDELEKLDGPIIVHLNKGQFQHFSVLRMTKDGTYYLADSIVGKVGYASHEFEEQYTGAALAIWLDDSPLPQHSPITTVRDGLSVSSTLGSSIRSYRRPFGEKLF
ncbi:hypothetical protein AUC68_12860 [Methyloceanibacter methanicus]|uniref:Peptidase C39 domain-containing protein n=1 Tax=Methyloceanibacter methanicus TaxID=1774968 RepID=A0A1E3W5Z1_9HYPH|nr:cysteine peptidase family C39 domain-containing protein [Methyloceanibacter methanicus]ODS01245.1 hypothetical protein AUC68_12860 [Methyloceanibacter methanicus]